MPAERLIKKYPNRRLYDTEESRYITLGDVRQLVIEERPFVVIDKKSERDITRSVLLQVISELEKDAESVLSQQFLAQASGILVGVVAAVVAFVSARADGDPEENGRPVEQRTGRGLCESA